MKRQANGVARSALQNGLRDQTEDDSEIPPTDFRRGVRNPYLILLAPDVWTLFPTAESVNAALRTYAAEHDLTRHPQADLAETLSAVKAGRERSKRRLET